MDKTFFVFESDSVQTALARMREEHEANRCDLPARVQAKVSFKMSASLSLTGIQGKLSHCACSLLRIA